jgi:GxxExxY protein
MLITPHQTDFPLKEETDLISGLAIEIHRILGAGFLEIVYKDAFEYELNERQCFFKREEEFTILYKNTTLRHKFYADFVVLDKVIVEIKAKEKGIAEEDLAQTINYL